MNVLLTGATGYIGLRLLPALLEAGHSVVCLVRDKRRFPEEEFTGLSDGGQRLSVIEGDLLDPKSLHNIPGDIEAAYFLVHSMGGGGGDAFPDLEARTARNFARALEATSARQIIYLSGIINRGEDETLSRHLASRLNVEEVLREAANGIPLTVLRAAIIVGAGSASFEIMRDLVEKLPVMITPKWLRTPCQPIAIRNVIDYLIGVLDHPRARGEVFDIGGPEVLIYEEMLRQLGEVRGLRRLFIPVPLLTPRLSSYWLYFVTVTSYSLARSLVGSLTHDMTCRENRIREIVPLRLLTYREAVENAFSRIAQNRVQSSWYGALASGGMDSRFLDHVKVPEHGVLTDSRVVHFDRDPDEVQDNLWRIGGQRGWYALDWAWRVRGGMDRLVGGTGLRRGRRDPRDLRPGEAVDFWRVLLADEAKRRLILFAEMKLPGEAWLEFRIRPAAEGEKEKGAWKLEQIATFRPRGLLGRLYWLAVLPMHELVFGRMSRTLVNYRPEPTPAVAAGIT